MYDALARHLLGMSRGGAIAIDFALTKPDMAGAFLLIASGIGGYPTFEETTALAVPIIEMLETGDLDQHIALTVRFWVDGLEHKPEEVDPFVRERVRVMYADVLRR